MDKKGVEKTFVLIATIVLLLLTVGILVYYFTTGGIPIFDWIIGTGEQYNNTTPKGVGEIMRALPPLVGGT